MSKQGKCCICGNEGPLSREHVPPAKAYNEFPVFLSSLWEHPKDGKLTFRKDKKQAGNLGYTLCSCCNSFTGGKYGSEYVKFAHTVAGFASAENEGQVFNLTFRDVKPLRVFKQVLSMFCSTCGPGFAGAHPIIPKMILNPKYREPIYPIRLYCYIRPAYEGTVATGVWGGLKLNTAKITTIAEVSWWPVGWVLSFNGHHIQDAFEVSDWWKFDYDEKRDINLDLLCRKPIELPFASLN